MNYEEMSDFEINLAVAKMKYNHPSDPEYFKFYRLNNGSVVQVNAYKMWPQDLDFCNNPSDSWSIIIENKISINHEIARYSADSLVYSKRFDDGFKIFRHEGKMGDTSSRAALRAAMICYLKMKDEDNINPHKEQITDIVGEEKL